MYQFKYQQINPFGFYPPISLLCTCVVPANWLSLDLPVMHGWVNYTENLENLVLCGEVVYEFRELSAPDKTLRMFSLDIRMDGKNCFEKPMVIHAPSSAKIEVLLLNHLLGFLATSALVAVDFADLIGAWETSSNFYFKYGVGQSPADILPSICKLTVDREKKSEFLMIFCDDTKLRLKYIDDAMYSMESSSPDEAINLICAAGVEQDEMLISTLVGRS